MARVTLKAADEANILDLVYVGKLASTFFLLVTSRHPLS